MAGNTLLFSEILDKVHKAKTKDQKVKILRDNNTDALRMVIKSSFDPQITWTIPSGSVPYQPNDVPAGTEHTTLATESRKLWHFIRGADNETPQFKYWYININFVDDNNLENKIKRRAHYAPLLYAFFR